MVYDGVKLLSLEMKTGNAECICFHSEKIKNAKVDLQYGVVGLCTTTEFGVGDFAILPQNWLP